MARRVFFAFDYQDVANFRVNVVRNHWMTKPDREAAGFFDASIWETARKTGPVAIKRLVNGALEGTSVSCVLVGTRTYARPWVRYEIQKSFRRGNYLLAVHVNSIPDKNRLVAEKGRNPLEYVGVTYSESGLTATLWERNDSNWTEYSEIEDGATYQTGGVAAQYRGKGFNLARWYGEYDWVNDDGYDNFARWVDRDV